MLTQKEINIRIYNSLQRAYDKLRAELYSASFKKNKKLIFKIEQQIEDVKKGMQELEI